MLTVTVVFTVLSTLIGAARLGLDVYKLRQELRHGA